MPDTSTTNVREAETQIAKYREELQKLRQEFIDDGEIDKEEGQILKDIESMIARVEAQLAAKTTGSGDGGTAEAEDAADEVIDRAEDAADNIIDEAEDAVNEVVDEAENAVNEAIDEVEDAADSIIDEAEDAVNEVIDRAEDAADSIIDEAEDAANTTDPVVPGGEEPVGPGTINAATASISGTVGKGGKNKAEDVETVQQLLNQNGASPALEVDGAIGPKTNSAISKFQQANLGFQDGRVDPGGQTLGALTGGGGAAPPSEFSGQDELKKLIDETPEALPPTVIVEEEDEEEDDASRPKPEGFWVDAEFTIKTPFFSIKVKSDKNGNVAGFGVEKNLLGSPGFSGGVIPIIFGVSVTPAAAAINFDGTGPKLPFQFKLSGKGGGFVGLGIIRSGVEAGVKIELEMEGEPDLPIGGVIDLDNLVDSSIDVPASTFGFPFEFFLNASSKASVGVEAKGAGPSLTIPIRSYDKLAILTIDAGPTFDLRKGPGFDEVIADVDKLRVFLEENPDAIGTGPPAGIPGFPTPGDGGNSVIDDAKDYIEETAEEIKDYIEEKVEEAEEIYDDVKEYAEEKFEEAEEFIKEKAGEVEEAYDDAKDYVEEKGEEILDDIIDLFSGDDEEEE